jgi:hypothetical protein
MRISRKMKIFKWLQRKLGVQDLNSRCANFENRLRQMEKLVMVGVDINYTSSSWIVVCLRGKREGQDVVRFFELPHGEIGRFLEELKYSEKRYRDRPVFDAPIGILHEWKF